MTRDPGAATERTTLAWRRTGLALVVAALVIGRVTVDELGPVGLAPALLGASAAAWVAAQAVRSRRLVAGTDSEPTVLADGTLPAVVAGLLVTLALVEAGAALAGALLP